jgi:hypothetical protein
MLNSEIYYQIKNEDKKGFATTSMNDNFILSENKLSLLAYQSW